MSDKFHTTEPTLLSFSTMDSLHSHNEIVWEAPSIHACILHSLALNQAKAVGKYMSGLCSQLGEGVESSPLLVQAVGVSHFPT